MRAFLTAGEQRQAFDSLRGPLRHDLITGNAPNFFSVRFEKDAIETFPKAV